MLGPQRLAQVIVAKGSRRVGMSFSLLKVAMPIHINALGKRTEGKIL